MNLLYAFWINEIDLNNTINEKLNRSFREIGKRIRIQKTGLSWPKGRPDGVLFDNNIARAIIEYKLESKNGNSTLQRAACQNLVYTYDKYGHSIVPIRLHIIITEKQIIGISFKKYEYLYDNFALIRDKYANVPPSSLYNESYEVRELLKDVDKLADFVISFKDIDFNEVAYKICALIA